MVRMPLRRFFWLIALVLVFGGFGAAVFAAEGDASAGADHRLRVLFLGDGHSPSHDPPMRLRDLAPAMLDRGIELVYTEDLAVLDRAILDRYPVLMIYGNHEYLSPEQEAALLSYVEDGGGLVAVHSASGMFGNSSAYIELIGGQFLSHGSGVFSERIAEPDHPIMQGYEPFSSWDETYVHQRHNEVNRTVLSYRENEPWTWVRTHGDGRVFYTAWGHDQRTFSNPGFHDLLERGIRWAAGQDVAAVMAEREISNPFFYVDVMAPVFQPGRGSKVQVPLPPEVSMQRTILPGGFSMELFASEPNIAKPIAMTWDEKGRLWIAESVDYPNHIVPSGQGNDRIVILEDTDGDGRADTFTVFADGLNIPTGLVVYGDGVIVHEAPDTVYLRDTDGDGRADVREVLFTGWAKWDTHAGPSNLRYGLDNWIWGTVGYAGFNGVVGDEHHSLRMGVYRFRPDGSELEFMGTQNNNTWGLGFTEEGRVFTSNANNMPSAYLGIPERYYDKVMGLSASFLPGIADRTRLLPITHNFTQGDWYNAYTSATGHAVYTARSFPEEYWNRAAFVMDPTAYLIGTFFLEPDGAGYKSYNPHNLLVSDDEWVAPIMAEVGPDGAVWVLDWYNYVLLHNLPPQGNAYAIGPGNAYLTDLRDKYHGRVYRIVWDEAEPYDYPQLSKDDPAGLVTTLAHENQFWRLQAQRLLVERGELDVVPALIELLERIELDAIGLDVGAIHALWTLHGLGVVDSSHPEVLEAVIGALRHPSAGVRENALQVLPVSEAVRDAILAADVLNDPDPFVRQKALLALADQPSSEEAGAAIFAMLDRAENVEDRWIREAGIIAAAQHQAGFLKAAEMAGISLDGAPQDVTVGENLVTNPSFTELDANGQPVGWFTQVWGGSAQFTVLEGAGREVGHAVLIYSETGADAGWSTQVQVKPHRMYRLSGWFQAGDVQNINGLGVFLHMHETQDYSGENGGRTQAYTGTHGWTYFETTFNSGNFTTMTLNLSLGGWGLSTGAVAFDDISLVEVMADHRQQLARVVELVARQ